MPNRILKESICTSEEINALTPFEETLFYRLIVNCDDYGRFDARGAVLQSRLFPLKDGLTREAVEKSLTKLQSAGLVMLYEAEGKPYVQILTWEKHQQIRAKKSKFPACGIQMIANESKCPRNPIQSESYSESESESKRVNGCGQHTHSLSCEEAALFSEQAAQCVKLWLSYKKERKEYYSASAKEALLEDISRKVKDYGDEKVCRVIKLCMSSNWKNIVWEKLGDSLPDPARQKTYDDEDIDLIVRSML